LELNSLADRTQVAVANLKKTHLSLFRCLQVEVAIALDWTEDDVASNDGIFVDDRGKPAEMKELESKLFLRRIFQVSHLPLGDTLTNTLFPVAFRRWHSCPCKQVRALFI
jgi:hypothetical protein